MRSINCLDHGKHLALPHMVHARPCRRIHNGVNGIINMVGIKYHLVHGVHYITLSQVRKH